MVRWIPDSAETEGELLKALGLSDTEELFADVPRSVRVGRLGLARGLEEPQAIEAVDKILARNRPYSGFANFLGGRVAVRPIPAAVDAILSRSEFYTSYTPYQPEASQGMLQALFEFQSLWVELTGLDAANASLYDGATAAGEALLLSRRIHEGNRFLVPASLSWEERSVLANYAAGHPIRIEEIPFDGATGGLELAAVKAALASGDVFGCLVEVPNGFGHLDEGWLELRALLGAIPLVALADPLALSVLEPPGAWGADIVVGEGQGFGAAPSFGGPPLGLFACRKEHLRYAPGRIVGATHDAEGRRAYTLTLQTREQHIRRSRATSNICTNQSLLALAFVVYASLVGPSGLRSLQADLAEEAEALVRDLSKVPGITAPRFSAPYLSDFTLEVAGHSGVDFLRELARRKVLGGVPLSDPRSPGPSDPFRSMVRAAATARGQGRARARYVRAARSLLAGGGAAV